MELKNRIAIWDNLKFVLIYTVVVGHLAEYYTEYSDNIKSLYFFIYLFHMPAFVFLAGMFGKNTISDRKYDKVLGYFVLYFVMKIIFYIARLTLHGSASLQLFYEPGVPWFIFAMAIYYLLTMFLQKFERKYVLMFSILLACFAGYDESIGDYFVLSRIIAFYPFFYIGFCMKQEKVIEKVKKKSIQISSLALLFMLAYVCVNHIESIYWLLPLLKGRYSFFTLQYPAYGCLLRAIWYVLGFVLILGLVSITPNRQVFFTEMGTRTIQVYALHAILIYIWHVCNMDIVMQLIWPEHWKLLTVFGAGMAFTVLFSWKVFSKPFQWILNPKKL